jgi:hypothetical protein
LFVSAVTWIATACSGDPAPGTADDGLGATADDDGDESDSTKTTSKPDAGKKDAGKADTGKGDAGTKAQATDAGASAKNLPCDIQALVGKKCLTCHGEKLASGVTFSLTSLDSFHQPAPSDDSRKIYEVAVDRVTATETSKVTRMPPASVSITAAETKTLADWLKAGAKGSAEKCAEVPSEADASVAPSAGGSGGASTKPIKYDDPMVKCYEFRAYTKGDKTKPYTVGTTPDFYVAFNINPTFTGTQYIKSIRALVDNKDVIHHWLFFKQMSKGSEGVTENAIGAHPDGELLAGWAPGGDDLYYDPDVGTEITGATTYQLEAHYNNKTGTPAPDKSGVEICITPTKPKYVANVSWVGTDSISSTTAVGQCTPSSNQQVHLIAGSPHMHLKGRHMKVVINRKDGTKETLHDEVFDFEYQRQYLLDGKVLNPGDTLTTTCTYSGPSRFGKGTNDEMCYFFTTHWPAGSLTSVGAGTIIHGPNSCLN